ncbi:hypothetical protein [Streptomyces sp. NRRL B-24484]|uniref:restriction system modified-DNA reader domain-containing protein n=1 Tax=Streptomyces sp. NRRL B-24484 TaxID=1463833 RepID=UPI0004C00437|nr:hypothetical protein [Streptomyces sp. NRRL B-24484]
MIHTTRTIEIDDDVFAYLQRHSEPLVDTPNDVLRRLLLDGVKPAADEQAGDRRGTGALMPFIERGWLAPEAQLHHTKKRAGATFYASVTADGWIRIADGRVFALPSPALKAQVGTEINGWGQYVVTATGETLQTLRTRLQLEEATA